MKAPVAVVILTYNEEKNIAQALQSIIVWATQVFVVDSYSTDGTCGIARQFACTVVQHEFTGYPQQRNWALAQLPITTEWVFFLDADEWMTNELQEEITQLLAAVPQENGFYIKRRFIWMGRWIKHGYYPTWILRLFRYGKGRCEERSINEHFMVEGKVGHLYHDFIHEDHRELDEWLYKHIRYAAKEAEELFKTTSATSYVAERLFGCQAERKRWIRSHLWNKFPPLLRPFGYFFYRFFLRGGFLDGKEAFIYHFLQGLWFPLLIDIKYIEMKKQKHGTSDN